MRLPDRKLAGLLSFIASVECMVGISLAEELYPGYSVSANPISDLGATCRDTCTIVQPASTVFNSSVVVLGILGFVVSYLIYRSTHRRFLSSFLFLAAFGAVGVGVFSETTGILHVVMSGIVFLFGGLSAIASYHILEVPMNYTSIALGILTLLALSLYITRNYAGLGQGGMERLVAYPALYWFLAFGAYLMKT